MDERNQSAHEDAMQAAVLEAISPAQLRQVVEKLLAMALDGNVAAAELLFDVTDAAGLTAPFDAAAVPL